MSNEIKYIEIKTDGVRGIGRIAPVCFSNSSKTIYYEDRVLVPLKGWAAKANYFDEKTHEEFWVSNPRKDGADSLFPAIIEIEESVRENYWTEIRNEPEKITQPSYRSPGKSKNEREKIENAVNRHDVDRRFRAP